MFQFLMHNRFCKVLKFSISCGISVSLPAQGISIQYWEVCQSYLATRRQQQVLAVGLD